MRRRAAALRMDESPSCKRARMESRPVDSPRSACQQFEPLRFPQCNGKKGADYLTWVSNFVSTHKNKTITLKYPAGATWKIGDLDDTVYRGQEDEVIGWGKFYLPEIVSMQVVGVVKGIPCAHDQFILMTCEDRKLYVFDGEDLHLVASSLEQLRNNGIQYPATKSYYNGEAFKHMNEKDWAKVSKRLDQEHHDLVMSKKHDFLENLKIIKQSIESGNVCMSLDCGKKPQNHHTGRSNSTKKSPKPVSKPVRSSFGRSQSCC